MFEGPIKDSLRTLTWTRPSHYTSGELYFPKLEMIEFKRLESLSVNYDFIIYRNSTTSYSSEFSFIQKNLSTLTSLYFTGNVDMSFGECARFLMTFPSLIV